MRLSDWTAFFSAEVGASATLAGLVIVAISINLTRILETDHLPSRAGESLFSLTTILITCSVALFPQIPPADFGLTALVFALLSLVFGARNQRVWRKVIGAAEIERRIIGGLVRLASTLPIVVGGAMLVDQSTAGIAVIAVGLLIALAASVMNAWVLLVEIMR